MKSLNRVLPVLALVVISSCSSPESRLGIQPKLAEPPVLRSVLNQGAGALGVALSRNMPGWSSFDRMKLEADLSAGDPVPAPNSLTATEKAGGWQLLFDGQTTKGWHSFNKKTVGPGWKVKDGVLGLEKNGPDEAGGDLVTDEEFQDFDLRLEWKISDCGNSGLMYNVVEGEQYCCPYVTGAELQILDNACHPDAKIPKHRAGDLYDMISVKQETVKPAGQWNKVRLRVRDGKVEEWLNGKKVIEFQMFNQQWTDMIAGSKFKTMPGFGTFKKGKICVQDHGDKVWFRNIKVKRL